MKKILACLLTVVILAALFTGCNSNDNAGISPPDGTAQGGGLKIVATIFPQYDWVRRILGANPSGAELTLLIGNGIDPHSFQPTADDMITVSTCDIFIYIGGESDDWALDALKTAVNPDIVAINLLEVLGEAALSEEIIEGMERNEEDSGLDEHVWLSLRHAQTLCTYISEKLGDLDPDNASIYNKNTADYLFELSALDAAYQGVADSAPVKTLLFADRFPFRYLVEDYGLDYYAAFPGCEAETEASFETVIFLAMKLDELNLKNVMVISSKDLSLANTVIDNSKNKDRNILVLDSLQGVTASDIEAGKTYLSVMESNLAVLTEALR